MVFRLVYTGTNVQTGEEVAVKLVSGSFIRLFPFLFTGKFGDFVFLLCADMAI